MIKAILIDDEPSALKSFKWEIEEYCKEVFICGVYSDPFEAIQAINNLKPDCVFLDIEMPKMDGFQLLSKLKYRDFQLIFTTAYDQYAISAFKHDALDYLLKPIDSDDLQKAVDKVMARKQNNLLGNEIAKIIDQFENRIAKKKIALSFTDKTKYIGKEEILYCKSDGNYTEIYLRNNAKEVISKQLKEAINMINAKNFFRVHHSYYINTDYIKEFIKSDGQYIVMENGASIPVSKSKKQAFLNFIEKA